VSAVVVAVVLVVAFGVFLATRLSGPAGSTSGAEVMSNLTPAERTRMEKATGLLLRPNASPPSISADVAVSTAMERAGGDLPVRPKASSWIANEEIPGGSDLISIQDRPVWIVSFEGVELQRSGPPDATIPRTWTGRRDVIIDSDTGQWLYTAEQGLEPASIPTTPPES
jgi:hypothetical protein